MVSFTITTDDDDVARLVEPNAPPPSERLKAVKILIEKGIPVSVRVDPIIPFLNDKPESLMKTVASIGVKHVTASTCKIKSDSWRRLSIALPEIAEKLTPLYFERGEKMGGYTYLPLNTRIGLLKTVRDLADKHNIGFGTCREGLAGLNTATCDGSWLLS
jgi:DNA repair photolyase